MRRVTTLILEMFKGKLRTGKARIEELPLYEADPMFEGIYYSWCVNCGRPNHCGHFIVENLGTLNVQCHTCRMVQARRRNYILTVAPSEMGWSL
jgi:hypothetical protein